MRLPDFIIGGMQKCGTTTLHHLLDQHPSVSIPRTEVHYFDADDPLTHPDFRPFQSTAPSLDNYARFFAEFPEGNSIGEDSTTYLASAVAPQRIKAVLPHARLIFMLRDPVARAYSHYWHLVGTGRVSHSFEHTLDTRPALINNSTYFPNLRTYLDRFEHVKIVLFEDLLADQRAVFLQVCEFLGLDHIEPQPVHSNRTLYPGGALSMLMNKVGSKLNRFRYSGHFEGQSSTLSRVNDRWNRLMRATLRPGSAPPMRSDTRQRLGEHLSLRNAGLSELIGRDLSAVWPSFRDS